MSPTTTDETLSKRPISPSWSRTSVLAGGTAFRATAGRSGDDSKGFSILHSVDAKICVEREDGIDAAMLGERNERGVGEVHRQVGVFGHEFGHALDVDLFRRSQVHESFTDELKEARLHEPTATRAEKIHDFYDYGPRCQECAWNRLKLFNTHRVGGIGFQVECNERSGIDEYHDRFPCFFAR